MAIDETPALPLASRPFLDDLELALRASLGDDDLGVSTSAPSRLADDAMLPTKMEITKLEKTCPRLDAD